MKKCIAIIAAMLFVLGFAASAFAIHAEIPAETSAIVVKGESTVTIGGELRFRGELKQTNVDSDKDTTAAYDGRVRILTITSLADGSITTYNYNAGGQLESVTDPDNIAPDDEIALKYSDVVRQGANKPTNRRLRAEILKGLIKTK